MNRASGAEHFGVLQSWYASFIREVTGVAKLPPPWLCALPKSAWLCEG